MEQSDAKIRNQLAAASELFASNQTAACRKLLSEIKSTHLSIEMNSILCEYRQSPQNIAICLKKLMDILTAIDIKLYEARPQETNNGKNKANIARTPRIAHEFYYWNIIILSQLMSHSQITELVCNEALHFTDGMRTETSLMILYQMLRIMQNSGRLASCISLIEKQNRLLSRAIKLKKEDHVYRFLNHILLNKVLLKLGMIEGSRTMYQMKFSPNPIQDKEELEVREISHTPIVIYRQLLNAEIEYHSRNYAAAVKILVDLVPVAEAVAKGKEFIRRIIDHNLALVLANLKQAASAQILLRRSLNFFLSSKQMQGCNERSSLIETCKNNMLLSGLLTAQASYDLLTESLKGYQNSYSYKMNYRKAQVCLNYYHQVLRNPSRVLTHKELHDFYETVYYYPNQPYFQQKSKNKNPNFTNGNYFYRRFVLPEWEQSFQAERNQIKISNKEKETNKISNSVAKEQKQMRNAVSKQKKSASTKQTNNKQEQSSEAQESKTGQTNQNRLKLRAILELSSSFLKQALTILQKQKKVIVNFEGEEKGYTEQVNQKLYSEYIDFKSSIYAQLCYISLCLHEWAKTLHFVSEYQRFEKLYQLQSKNSAQQRIYYNIMSYKVEALCELNRTMNAYETIHEFIGAIDYSQVALPVRSTANQRRGQTYFESMTQYNNLCFNLSVLHSRDNKIPEAFQSIQKILQQMRLSPSNPQANLPLSIIELLIHYNLRTGNTASALQMIKRRRILNVPGVLGHYQPTLAVTK